MKQTGNIQRIQSAIDKSLFQCMLVNPYTLPTLAKYLTHSFTDQLNFFIHNPNIIVTSLLQMNPLLISTKQEENENEEKNEINSIFKEDNYELLKLKLVNHLLDPNYRDRKGISLIEKSVFFNSKKCIDFLLEENVSIDRHEIHLNFGKIKIGLMEYGALKGNKKVVNFCLEKGQNIELQTLLAGLVTHQNDLFEWMFEKGKQKGLFDDSIKAAVLGLVDNIEFNEKLIKSGTDINESNVLEKLPLSWASEEGHIEVVRELIERGADVNAKSKYGETALICASQNGHIEIFRELIERGADINAKNNRGNPLLILALSYGHIEVVKELIERGADINAKNDDGYTALIEASANGHTEVVRELINRGADINAKANNGWTALIYASYNGRIEVVRELINRGADINLKTNNGKTALNYAHSKKTS